MNRDELVTGVESGEDKCAVVILSNTGDESKKYVTTLPLSELTSSTLSEWVNLNSVNLGRLGDRFQFIDFDEVINHQMENKYPTVVKYAGMSLILRIQPLIEVNCESGFSIGDLYFKPTTTLKLATGAISSKSGYLVIDHNGKMAVTTDPLYHTYDFLVYTDRHLLSTECEIFTYSLESGSVTFKLLG